MAAVATKTPWAHQVKALELLGERRAVMLAWEMGCGKTFPVLRFIADTPIPLTLILAPKNVVPVWAEQYQKHIGGDAFILSLDTGSTNSKAAQLRTALQHAEISKRQLIVAVNYDAAWRSALAKLLLQTKWGLMVCDESHRIKTWSSKCTKFCKKLGKKVPKRVALTGTPMAHSPLDVFGQFQFLDESVFGWSWVKFRSQYARLGGYNNRQILGFKNEEELNRRFYSIAHRVTKEEVLPDLPEWTDIQHYVELSPSAMKIYREFESEMVVAVGDGLVTATNAMVKTIRLHQITSGYVSVETAERKKIIHDIDNAKSRALAEFLGDIDARQRVVVFCRFTHDINKAYETCEAAERPAYRLYKQVNEHKAWQQGRDGGVLVAQIKSGGEGLDMTSACYGVYYSLGHSLGDYDQSKARIHRPGQKNAVTYVHLVARNTVEVVMYKARKDRANIIGRILNYLCPDRYPYEQGDPDRHPIEERCDD